MIVNIGAGGSGSGSFQIHAGGETSTHGFSISDELFAFESNAVLLRANAINGDSEINIQTRAGEQASSGAVNVDTGRAEVASGAIAMSTGDAESGGAGDIIDPAGVARAAAWCCAAAWSPLKCAPGCRR